VKVAGGGDKGLAMKSTSMKRGLGLLTSHFAKDNTCPVLRRFLETALRELQSLNNAGGLYAPQIEALEELGKTSFNTGRGHTQQLLRGFYLLERSISALMTAHAAYDWSQLEPLLTPSLRSYEGLTRVIDVLDAQKKELWLLDAEAELGQLKQQVGGVDVFRVAPPSAQLQPRIESLSMLAWRLREKIRAQSKGDLGQLGRLGATYLWDLERSGDKVVNDAQVLAGITEGNPVSPWKTTNEYLV